MSLRLSLERWLGKATAETIRRERPTVIAVTGTVGKSSTKQAIAAILEANEAGETFRVSPKNYNNELGLPLTVFDLLASGRSVMQWLKTLWRAWITSRGWRRTGVKTFVFEMGADKPGDLSHLTAIAPPDIAVITAVTPEDPDLVAVHVAHYPSMEALTEEKATLVRSLRPDGTAILNADDRRVFAMRHLTSAHVLTFGEADGTDIRLIGSRVLTEPGEYGQVPIGLEIAFESLNRRRVVRVPGVFGRSIAYALCAATGVAVALDLAAVNVVEQFEKNFLPLPGRARLIPGVKHTTLLDDTYNASPASVVSALRDLASIRVDERQRKVACLGEMRELGANAPAMHRLLGAAAARHKIDLLVACGTLASAMAEGARANGLREDQIKIFDDTPAAGRFLQDWIRPGDLVLAKASQGSIRDQGVRMERVIKELMAEPQRAAELLVRQEEAWRRK